MRLLTLNVQNLRLRRDAAGRPRLDGARDGDAGEGEGALDLADRRLTAGLVAGAAADVVCLQEVFDRATLDFFADHFLAPAGATGYRHRVCREGNDGRGRNLALLSRLALARVASHAAATPAGLGLVPPPGLHADRPLFRRDCLVAEAGGLVLFAVHLKAPWPDPARARAVRRLEAEAVRRLVERRFADPAQGLWLILGDLNESAGAGEEGAGAGGEGEGPAVAPLLPPFAVDLLGRLPRRERWTFHLAGEEGEGGYGCPDGLLASPALARRYPAAVPEVLRMGLARAARRHAGPRLAGVGEERPHASDHAGVAISFPGL
ncbi:MAG: endonuclease/exonuclease/phosphatase family protein [Rhodobacteraceae bacterium]|nr:endonuclease/exonuclease/phosphatase family protein [Paracoccaceae bacterium]